MARGVYMYGLQSCPPGSRSRLASYALAMSASSSAKKSKKGCQLRSNTYHLRNLASQKSPSVMDSGEAQPHYMILSVKHIMLCYATGPNLLKHTAPEPLFNGDYGIGSPSDLALDYLIWATASARPTVFTPLQLLPVEVQDIILNYVSVGTVEAAKVGCLLGLGSPSPGKMVL